ncbi:MAG TPA: type II toxin-antitoxin system VapC family toxin [Gammaproteobacteria bacterium]|nr:type II toxin-antitoxin system VapC family toxin [Gammaproteobacteria bacterium]
MFLLDTNLCIRILTTPAPHLQRKFKMHSPDEIALCSIVKSELLYGARHSQQVEANLQLLNKFFAPLRSLFFDDRCAEEAGQIRADLAARGQPIGPNDLLIAATARAHNAILVTHNIREFSRVANLNLEDWEEEYS